MNALLLMAVATVGIDYRFAACSNAVPADLQIAADADGLVGESISLEGSHMTAPGSMPNMLVAANRGLGGLVRQVQCQDGSCGLTGAAAPQTQVIPVQQTIPQLAQPLPQLPPSALSPFTVQQARLASPVVQSQPQQQRGLCGR